MKWTRKGAHLRRKALAAERRAARWKKFSAAFADSVFAPSPLFKALAEGFCEDAETAGLFITEEIDRILGEVWNDPYI